MHSLVSSLSLSLSLTHTHTPSPTPTAPNSLAPGSRGKMTTTFSYASSALNLHSRQSYATLHSKSDRKIQKFIKIRCNLTNDQNRSSLGTSKSDEETSESENVLLKAAWYGSELLGIAASFFRSPVKITGGDESSQGKVELSVNGPAEAIDRSAIVAAIKDDFQRSYFVTGNLTLDAYEEACEFADPAGSFRGLRRFKRNCTNFGSLVEKSNMNLRRWEDFEDKSIGHWRFSCILSFPWKPILSATGYTEYYFDEQSGKVNRHVEHWNVPKMALLKQIFRPTRGFWPKWTS